MMTQEEIRTTALELLAEIAPEADLEQLDPLRHFRDQFDFDSIDFLNFAVGLQKALQIQIPEIEFPLLATLDSCVSHLHARLERLSE